MILFPPSKINIGLNVLDKREDGYHDIETVFYPIKLYDGLEIVTSTSTKLKITGLEIEENKGVNLCLKAYVFIKERFDLPPIDIHLHKNIPIGAGLGGGSADGTYTLLLLKKKFNLKINDGDLTLLALQLGSDCPFFIKTQPCYAKGRGEILQASTINLDHYKILIVNPGIHINTGWAFSNIKPSPICRLRNIDKLPIGEWRQTVVNQFEEVVFERHPEIEDIKKHLYETGALYASMSGTGSTVYGIFEKDMKTDLRFPSSYFIKEC